MARRSQPTTEPALVVDESAKNREYLEQEPERDTRGAKKNRALQLERLGEVLVKLPEGKLARVPMPDDLKAAVVEARRILAKNARGGYRRQINFIGKIMRTLDAQPIADALEQMKNEDAPSAAAFRLAERWRDKLVDEGDAALEELVAAHPDLAASGAIDRTKLRQLMRAKSVRALFKELHAAFRSATPAAP